TRAGDPECQSHHVPNGKHPAGTGRIIYNSTSSCRRVEQIHITADTKAITDESARYHRICIIIMAHDNDAMLL
uniref:hypothetical protein n=1 Tax=Alistipes shahii TaxID=328814 RepID=UPI0040282848